MDDSSKASLPDGKVKRVNKLHPLIVKSNDDSATHENSSVCSVDSENGLWTPSTCSNMSDVEADSGIGVSNTSFAFERLHLDHDGSVTPTFPEDWIPEQNTSKHRYSDDRQMSSPLYQENELQYYDRKRSSSLKSKRTPPGTPNNKMVRFADAFGLDLESVRTVFNQESPPKIPASAISDLHWEDEEELKIAKKSKGRFFNPRFPQPGAGGNFIHRVKQQNVCLENSVMDHLRLTGTVRVRNIAFDKRVVIRITFDNWRTINDVEATYSPDSNDGVTDRFSFSTMFPDYMLMVGSKAEFAILYILVKEGQEFWDNNYGINYVYECFSSDGST